MTDMVAHARSAGVVNPRLNLFDVPKTDLSMASRRYVKITPFNTGINPVDFQIDPQSDFIDMNDSYFEVELRLKKDDGSNLALADQMLPVNNLCHSLFKQIICRLNGTLISPQTDTYHHKAFLEQILNNDRVDGENLLPVQGWFNSLKVPDEAEKAFTANEMDPTKNDHKALKEDFRTAILNRQQFFSGKKVTMRFKPFLEVFHLNKLLVPGVQIQINMYFNSADIWGMVYGGARTFRLTEDDVKVTLYLAQVRLTPSIYLGLMDSIRSGKQVVSYPTVRGEIRTYTHPSTERYFECNNPFRNQVPNRLIVAMLRQDAFNGDKGRYPFSYQKFNLSSIKQLIRGEEYPYETLDLQHDDDSNDLRGYHRYLLGTGSICRNKGDMVRRDDWGHGKLCTLFVFDNTANGCLNTSVLNPKQSGELRIVIQFGANPGANLVILVYGEFENMMEIDRNNTVTYDVYQP